MLLVVDVGNTQTHFGTFRGDELVEHWRFATVRESTADELGAALRNLLELRGVGLADLDGVDRLLDGARSSSPSGVSMAERYLGHRMLAVGPGLKTGMPIRIDNPRELGADRLVNAVAAYERVGGAVRRRRLRHRRSTTTSSRPRASTSAASIAPGRRDLARGADRARRQAPARSTSARRASRDRQVDGRRDPRRRRLRLRRPRSTASSRRIRDELGDRRADDRHRRPRRRRSSRSPRRSTRSTTCSR